MTVNLSRNALLVALHVSVWTARATDRKVTDEVHQRHNASRQSGKYRKLLIPDACAEYDAVNAAASALRTLHWKWTLPWAEDGVRVLRATAWMDYLDEFNPAREKFQATVEAFIAAYPDIKERAKKDRTSMFLESDYPSASGIRHKFGISLRPLPAPDAADFRTKLGGIDEGERNRLAADAEAAIRAEVTTAMKDPYRRMHALVSRMAERLGDPEAKFKDSLVGNLSELCDILPALNLTGDPQLAEVGAEVREKLTALAPDALRDNTAMRSQVAADAEALTARLAGIWGGAE